MPAFGLMFFIFTMGVVRSAALRHRPSLAGFLLYGGMIWGLFPTQPHISFEYHLAGATLGLVLAVLLRRLDPPAPEKTYRWEQEGGEEDDWPFDERPGKEDDGTGNDRPPPAPDASRAESNSAPSRP